jgi:hypothetical protein
VAQIVLTAKKRAVADASEMLEQIWRHFRGIETKGRFQKRLAVMLDGKPRRIRDLMAATARRVDVHEIEGLRAILRKLSSEGGRAGQESQRATAGAAVRQAR